MHMKIQLPADDWNACTQWLAQNIWHACFYFWKPDTYSVWQNVQYVWNDEGLHTFPLFNYMHRISPSTGNKHHTSLHMRPTNMKCLESFLYLWDVWHLAYWYFVLECCSNLYKTSQFVFSILTNIKLHYLCRALVLKHHLSQWSSSSSLKLTECRLVICKLYPVANMSMPWSLSATWHPSLSRLSI